MELNMAEKRALFDEINRGLASHAYIVEGIPGVGKRSFARALAQALLCTGETKPCGNCSSCRKCEAGTHPDLHICGASGTSFKVDTVRDIKRRVTLKPNEGDRTVCILQDAGLMTIPAQNALLKVLEEPPEGTVLVLLTAKREALLPTVRSRARTVRLHAASDETVRAFLAEKFPKADAAALDEAVRMAAGSAGAGEAVLKNQGKAEREGALKLCAAVYGRGGRYDIYAAFLGQSKKRDALLSVIDRFTSAARDVLVCKLGCASPAFLPRETALSCAKTAAAGALYGIFEASLECSRSLRRNTDPGIALSQLCARITQAKGR